MCKRKLETSVIETNENDSRIVEIRMNSLDETLRCAHCQSILKTPVFLPCGHSICQEHQQPESRANTSTESQVESTATNNKSIDCKVCQKIYNIPESGFVRNIMGEQLLENRLHLAVAQNAAFKACLGLRKHVTKVRRLQSIAKTTIVSHFLGEIKTKVNKKRDEMKQKIDSDADKLVNEISQLETECNNKTQNPLRSETITKLLKPAEETLIKLENEELMNERGLEEWNGLTNEANRLTVNLNHELLISEKELFNGQIKDIRLKQDDFCKLNIEAPKTLIINCEVKINSLNSLQKPIFPACKSQYGIDWHLVVSIENTPENLEKMIVAYLCPSKNNDRYNISIDGELAVLNRYNSNKNIVKSIKHLYEENKGKGCHIAEFSKITSNPEFYDPKEESFTVQATISNIDWIKVEYEIKDN